MNKKTAIIIALILTLLMLCACGGTTETSGKSTKTVHCDNCTTELSIDEDSSMNDDWIVYCEPCSEELFSGEDLIGDEVLPEIPTVE